MWKPEANWNVPLSANPTKWPNTLNSRQICLGLTFKKIKNTTRATTRSLLPGGLHVTELKISYIFDNKVAGVGGSYVSLELCETFQNILGRV